MSGTACQYEQMPKKRGPKTKHSDASDLQARTQPSLLSGHDDASPLPVTATPLFLTTNPACEGQILVACKSRLPATDSAVSPFLGTADLNHTIETIHQDPVGSIEAIDMKNISGSLDAIVKRRVDIFMIAIFGIRPIVSEVRIRPTSASSLPM